MTILRALMIVLLLANLLFLVAGRDLFGGPTRGEPARLAAQIDPQKIRLLTAGEHAPAPPPIERSAAGGEAPGTNAAAAETKANDGTPEAPPQAERCVAVAGLTGEQVAALKAKLGSEDSLKLRDRGQEASSWWVNLPPLPDRAAAVKRAEEVRGQGVSGAFIIREEGEHRNAVSLALFKSEAAAQEFMRQLQDKGVTGARVTIRSLPGSRHTLDVRGPEDRVAELVELALAANSGARREQCAGR
ncbi:MAG: SPOR domain-containing protein [Sterolibacteriaceae bacterium]|uniref:SPOR domain-containing protein n=1 Tax=Candidatus Methylophosphatis roskildensis TaxID=2899263 RepID=A0A9D7DZS1_9PROT|nr:SPOR domain-containing protein [Candidatus Methylophosphatis roskildensis]MBK7234550.1 SPOR domain-containing protein [Sterolibacteriaceae bacterium]